MPIDAGQIQPIEIHVYSCVGQAGKRTTCIEIEGKDLYEPTRQGIDPC